MPFTALKNWQYFRALNKLPGLHSFAPSKKEQRINPARQFLLFINGTKEKDLQFFQSLHQEYEKQGHKIKILAFIQSKEEIQHFAMALYNEKSIQWNEIPKPKLVELVTSRHFDILYNINPQNLKHLHFLAVAATADFKVSTFSELPNDFSLTIKTKNDWDQKQIYEQMRSCLETLST